MGDSGHVEGSERRQRILLPSMLDEYVDENNSVRFIDAFVDSLDLKKLEFKRSEPNEIGRPSYAPADLLKLYIYGYLNQIRSSRKLERECHRNMELAWLMKKLCPMAESAKETLGVNSLNITADSGYHDAEEIKACVEKGITPYIPQSPRVLKKESRPTSHNLRRQIPRKALGSQRENSTRIDSPMKKRLTHSSIAPRIVL